MLHWSIKTVEKLEIGFSLCSGTPLGFLTSEKRIIHPQPTTQISYCTPVHTLYVYINSATISEMSQDTTNMSANQNTASYVPLSNEPSEEINDNNGNEMSLQETFGHSLAKPRMGFMRLALFLIFPDLCVVGIWSAFAVSDSYLAIFVIFAVLVLVNILLRISTLCHYHKRFVSPQQLEHMSGLLVYDIYTHAFTILIVIFTAFGICTLGEALDDDGDYTWGAGDYTVLAFCIVVVLGHLGLFYLEIILYRLASGAWKTWNYELVAAREPREQVDLVVE